MLLLVLSLSVLVTPFSDSEKPDLIVLYNMYSYLMNDPEGNKFLFTVAAAGVGDPPYHFLGAPPPSYRCLLYSLHFVAF